MKVLICGKGGSGKSTLSVLLARTLNSRGYDVLLVDADESNLGLGRLLGISSPVVLTEALGGKKGARDKMLAAFSKGNMPVFANETWKLGDIPADFISQANGIRLLTMGKILHFGEGCACAMGGLSKTFLSNLRLGEKEVVIVDTEAGVEHFGRGVETGCDMVLAVADPSFESFMLAERIEVMGKSAGLPVFFLFNKVEATVEEIMAKHIDPEKVICRIARNENLFLETLKGRPLQADWCDLEPLCDFIGRWGEKNF